MRPLITVLIVLVLMAPAALEAKAVRPSGPELEALDDGEIVDLDMLLEQSPYTFLVFWRSGCDECVESLIGCQEFVDEYGGSGISVIGINYDLEAPWGMAEDLGRSGVRFPQLHDRYSEASSIFGVAAGTFTIILTVGGDAVARVDDPGAEAKEAMVSMFTGGGEEEPVADDAPQVPAGAALRERVMIGGEARLKFLSIDTEGDDATGPYGEAVEEGDRMLQRFELSVSGKLTKRIEVGGLVRVSNEGRDVLRGGPDYFDSEYGSAFASIDAGDVSLRLGYFSFSMTPLTMMRWDWDDNPRTGGNAGCGCGDVAGVLSSESLELLGPDYRMEGAIARYASGGWTARLFYAMPRRARAIDQVETSFGGEEMAAYSLETSGLQLGWRRFDARTGSYYEAGIHAIASWEDPRSIDCLSLGYSRPFDWYETATLSLTATVPVVRGAAMRGEMMALNRTTVHSTGEDGGERNRSEVTGGIAGLTATGRTFDLSMDYMRLPSGYFSPFAAMSYEAGLHGLRGAARISLPGGRFSVHLFIKRLEEIESAVPDADKLVSSTAGLALDLELEGGAGASAAVIEDYDRRDGDVGGTDIQRMVYTLSGRFRFSRNSWIEAQLQRVDNTDDSPGVDAWSRTDMASVFVSGRF